MQRIFVLLMLMLPGCASDTPVLYTLGLRPGPMQAHGPRVIVIRSVGVPRYLDRLEIVRAAGQGRLVASDDNWWAEPLRLMLRRVMVDDLAQRLPASEVLADGTVAAHPDAEVQIELQRFEVGGPDLVSLSGYVAIEGTGRPHTMDRLRIDVPVGGSTVKDHVGAMSTALGQAADVIAARLAR